MKRKIALLLAFVMVFSLVPMSVSAVGVRPGGGGVVSLPNSGGSNPGMFVGSELDFQDAGGPSGPLVCPDIGPLPGSTAANPGINPHHATRGLSIHRADFVHGVGDQNIVPNYTVFRAYVAVNGLGSEGRILPSLQNLRAFNSLTASGAAILNSVLPANRQVAAGYTALEMAAQGVLSASVVSGSNYMVVTLTRASNNSAWLTVAFEGDVNDVGGAVNTWIPINYWRRSNSDVNAVISWAGGWRADQTIRLADSGADRFIFELDEDDIRPFARRIRLDDLVIRESVVGMWNDRGVAHIGLVLDRGFSWAPDLYTDINNAPDPSQRFFRVESQFGNNGIGVIHNNTHWNVDGANFANAIQNVTAGNWTATGAPIQRIVGNPTNTDNVRGNWSNSIDEFGTGADAGFADMFRGRDRRRVAAFAVNPTDPPAGATTWADSIYIGGLQILANEDARVGDVGVEIVLLDANFNDINSGRVVVARYERYGIIFDRVDDHDLEDWVLQSGIREWELVDEFAVDGAWWRGGRTRDWDSVEGAWELYHQTASFVLTETVPGVLPFTGLRDIVFEFDEGIQVLGVYLETNDDDAFIDAHDDQDGTWWFAGRGVRQGFMDAVIHPHSVTINPEIGRDLRRQDIAEITGHFYISIMPGFEQVVGDTVVVTARGPGFEDGLTAELALVEDPIRVRVEPVLTIDDDGEAAWGRIRHESIGDIIIEEMWPGALRHGSTLWLGVEGGVSLGANHADLVSLGANAATVVNEVESNMLISNPIRDPRGTFIEIRRESRDEPATLRFSGVEISGALVADTNYGIIVAGSAVADNFGVAGFDWEGPLFGGGGFTRQGHGLFYQEPYLTNAFRFEGADVFDPGVITAPPSFQPPVATGPRTIHQAQPFSFVNPRNGQPENLFPPFTMVNSPIFAQTGNADAFLAAILVEYLLGWSGSFDAAASSGTFNLPDGRVVVFTNGSSTALVNGVPTPILNGDGVEVAARINPATDRFEVPIRFFRTLGVNVTFIGGGAGNNSLVVAP